MARQIQIGDKIKVRISNTTKKENIPSYLSKDEVYSAEVIKLGAELGIKIDLDLPKIETTQTIKCPFTNCMRIGGGNWLIVEECSQ